MYLNYKIIIYICIQIINELTRTQQQYIVIYVYNKLYFYGFGYNPIFAQMLYNAFKLLTTTINNI